LFINNLLKSKYKVKLEQRQIEFAGVLPLLALLLGLCGAGLPALADDNLNPNGATFRDFAIADNGASFTHIVDSMTMGGATAVDQKQAKVIAIEANNSLARVRFDSVKVQLALPLGWQAGEDWERGVAYSADKSFRLIVWRVDFAYEGVLDAEHYAETKTGSIRARRSTIQAQARRLGDGTFLNVYENVPPGPGDKEPRSVLDLLIPRGPGAKDAVLLTLGMPASQGAQGLKLLALIKYHMKIDW
jgi:hypothetical protein